MSDEKYVAREVNPEELRLKGRIVKDDKYGKMASVLYDRKYSDQPAEWDTVVYSGHEVIKFPSFTVSRVGYLDVFGNGNSVCFFAIIKPEHVVSETVKGRKAWGIKILDIELKSVIPGHLDINTGVLISYETERPANKTKFLPGRLSDMMKAFSGKPVNAPIIEKHEVGHHITLSFSLMTEVYVPDYVVPS